MGCLCIYHPDIEEFIEAKSWDKDKLTQFNMSVLIDDSFMYAVENDMNIYLHYPCMTEDGRIEYDKDKWIIKKEIKAKDLWDKIMARAYNFGEPGVLYYDNFNKDNNLYYMENIVTTNPCSEYISGVLNTDDGKEYMGCCNLGSLFLHNYVVNPFQKNAYFDFDKLKGVIPIAVRMLDNIIDINYYPLEAFENYQKNTRTIGIGITGLHDMLCMLNMDYSSVKSLDFVDELMEFIVYNVYSASVELAKEKGSFNFFDAGKFVHSNFIKKHRKNTKSKQNWHILRENILKYGIRNARMISIAPTGTLSLTFGENCSSGLEPIFDLEYDRTVKIGGQEDKNEKVVKVVDYAYDLWKNTKPNVVNKNVFKTATKLDVYDHIAMLNIIAYHTDMSCSKTINVPTEASFEEVKQIFYDCWVNGIKGCTIFRPNKIRQGIFNQKENENLVNNNWLPIPNDTTYIRKKIHTGCGKLVLFVGYSPSEDRLTDFYVKRSANGGCVHNIDAVVIAMSGMMRLGGNLNNIEKAFEGCGTCNSFTTARLKGKKLSKGKSCPTAILNAIKEVEDEVKNINIIVNNEVENQSIMFSEEEKEFIKENGEVAFALATDKCPSCGSKLTHSGSCVLCNQCGFTKCE